MLDLLLTQGTWCQTALDAHSVLWQHRSHVPKRQPCFPFANETPRARFSLRSWQRTVRCSSRTTRLHLRSTRRRSYQTIGTFKIQWAHVQDWSDQAPSILRGCVEIMYNKGLSILIHCTYSINIVSYTSNNIHSAQYFYIILFDTQLILYQWRCSNIGWTKHLGFIIIESKENN